MRDVEVFLDILDVDCVDCVESIDEVLVVDVI
jgi:hypothetical protein